MIDTSVKKKFLQLFYHEIKDHQLDKSNKLNLFVLKIQNNAFAYNELVDSLSNQIYHFALSRTEVKRLKEAEEYGTLVNLAKEKFRVHTSNEGELGEVLLYCLLESHLNAPKLLTKLEIKTAKNDYVKGADGVHLLQVSDNDFQLIFGESKLNSDLSKGVSEAFKSIKTMLSEDKIQHEISLVNSQLIKETADDNTYDYLKSIIVPKASEDKYNTDYAFGIFLGFNAEITDEEQEKSNTEFRTELRKKIQDQTMDIIKSINFQINKSEFNGYSFYVYVIPFSDLQNKRKGIIESLTQ